MFSFTYISKYHASQNLTNTRTPFFLKWKGFLQKLRSSPLISSNPVLSGDACPLLLRYSEGTSNKTEK